MSFVTQSIIKHKVGLLNLAEELENGEKVTDLINANSSNR